MPITTKHLSESTTSGVTGFGGSAGTPANFANPDDANLFSQITANMDSGVQDSRAFNKIELTGLNDWIPASTITTRKIVIKYRQTLTSIGDAPADCQFISGYRYSLNGGGAWTVVQVLQTGPNLNYDSGILEDFITLPGAQDISQVQVEAFAEVNKTSGGGTASVSHSDIQAFHAYVETYEDAVDLIRISPTSETVTTFGTADIAQAQANPANARDGNLATLSEIDLHNEYNFPSDVEPQQSITVVHNWPLLIVPTQILDAVIRFKWDGQANFAVSGGIFGDPSERPDVHSSVSTAYSGTGGSSWGAGLGSGHRLSVTHIDWVGGVDTNSKPTELVYYRIPSPNVATDQFKLRWDNLISTTIEATMDPGDDWQIRAQAQVYEVWLELRIESSQETGGGWLDV